MLRRQPLKKVWIVIIIAVIVAGAAILGFKTTRKRGQDAKKAALVRLEKPVRGQLIEYVTCPGKIEPTKKVTISAKVSARIIELPFDEGAKVTRGDANANPPIPPSVLVRLDATDLETGLKIAQAKEEAQRKQIEVEKKNIESLEDSLKSTQASLRMAELDFKRMAELLQTQDVSQSDYDKAKTAYDELTARYDCDKHKLESSHLNIEVLQSNLEAAQAEILRSKEALTYTTITSPIDGVITQLNAEVGEVTMYGTMNNPGTVIMEVADMSKMQVAAEIDEVEISKVKVGQKARIRIPAFPDEEFTGIVNTVALKSSLTTVGSSYYKAEVLVDSNGVGLCSGLTADVDIEVKVYEDVLKIPTQAVLGRKVDDLSSDIRTSELIDKTKPYATVVYKYNDGKAKVTPVKMGPSDLTDTVILQGIDANDVIVTGPYKVLENLKNSQALKDEKQAKKEKEAKDAKKKNQKAAKANDADK
jgi:HlyD family secretion protein